MNTSEAREHLELVERIISASSSKLEAGGEFFVVWGVASATVNLIIQWVLDHRFPPQTLWLCALIDVGAVLFSILRSRHYKRTRERSSFLQREFLNVLWLAFAMAFVADAIGFSLFPAWGSSAVWNLAAGTVLFYIGLHGNRRATVAAIVIVVSIAIANFEMAYAGYALGAGMLLGYAGFGAAELLSRA